MNLPRPLLDDLERTIGEVGQVSTLERGSFSSASRIHVGGEAFFLKYGKDHPPDFYSAEAAGLDLLRDATDDVRIPSVLAARDVKGGWSWIAVEWMDSNTPPAAPWPHLGAGLAHLHRASNVECGWNRDGYIGRLPQINTPANDWANFWIHRRLGPQLAAAREAAHPVGSETEWDGLFEVIPSILAPAENEPPSLLHGDLWRGNVMLTGSGVALVDPSCYWGHREVDLAMTRLFGGFPPEFYAAYDATWPLQAGYEVRLEVYQLYYLLVHVNLFGAPYPALTVTTLRSVLRAHA